MVADRYKTAFTLYPYRKVAEQSADVAARHSVTIIGGGPVGMALALDLGLKDIPVLVLDDHEGVGAGSRAICFSKRTLEIADRMGCGEAMVEKGVVWNVGKVFRDTRQIYGFDLLPEDGHRRPAFINLPQPYFEKAVVERLRQAQADGAPIEIRGRNAVTGIDPKDNHVMLDVDTPDGPYRVNSDWVVACDGARSPVRSMMGLGFEGRVFEDNFLIADVKMKADFPTERWFWFDPPFNRGQSALLHKQPDDIWRIDFQLGWDIDRQAELDPDRVKARVRAMLGKDVEFELDWVSIYTFQCASMTEYRHGRVFFSGDSAHQVSPFGARGCNGGIQDVDNLAWKLTAVIEGRAPDALLDSYQAERKHAADENILNSSRATDFLTPKTAISRMFRNAVLDLAEHAIFARSLVNSGRLSVPAVYDNSPLNGPDHPDLPLRTRPGSALSDAPAAYGWLLDALDDTFTLLAINTDVEAISVGNTRTTLLGLDAEPGSLLAERYLGRAATAVYLIRPDLHVAARWVSFDRTAIESALATALGRAI